jgi:GntR family transcriptional regulator
MLKQRQPPRYEQIAADLIQRIHSGSLAPGAPFPSVREVAEHYSCAQATAHSATKLLRDGGRIERTSSGMCVSVHPTVSSPRERLRRIQSGGPLLRPGETQHIIAASLVSEPPLTVVGRLGLEPGSAAGGREYVVTDRDDHPVTYGVSWFTPELWETVAALRRQQPIPNGNIGAIYETTGRLTVDVPPTYESRLGTRPELQALDLPDGAHVLIVITTCVDAAGEVTEYNESAHPEGYRVGGDTAH